MWMHAPGRRLAVAVSLTLVCAAWASSAVADGEPTGEAPVTVPDATVPPVTVPPVTVPPVTVPPVTVPETSVPGVATVDGVEVGVGVALVPMVPEPVETGEVDGDEVAVGVALVAPTTTRPQPAAATVSTPARPVSMQRRDAVTAASQLIESMETISLMLDAWG